MSRLFHLAYRTWFAFRPGVTNGEAAGPAAFTGELPMARMGQEVTPGSDGRVVRAPRAKANRSRYVLDLREQLPMGATLPQPMGGLTGGARRHVPEQAGALEDTGRTEEKGLHRRREGIWRQAPSPVAALRRMSRRDLLIQISKALITLAGAIVFLALNIPLAERFIGIYFVVSVVYAIDSQRTFLVALIFLVLVAVWSGLGRSLKAEDFAIYAFYFLVIGLIGAVREMVFTKTKP